MGSQSGLLILLVVIVAVIAVYVGMTMFTSGNIEAERDQIRTELQYLANEAWHITTDPQIREAGGERSFSSTEQDE